jgi:hypothetical protein
MLRQLVLVLVAASGFLPPLALAGWTPDSRADERIRTAGKKGDGEIHQGAPSAPRLTPSLEIRARAGSISSVAYRRRPTAPQNTSYKVYWYNVKSPNRRYLYGTYTNYAAAVRAVHYLNEDPDTRAYLVSVSTR